MKMVKTFMKTQHQHVMPPKKGRKERKGNAHSKSTRQAHWPRPRASSPTASDALEDRVRDGRTASRTEHSATPQRSASLCSVTRTSKGSSPMTSPHPPAPGRGKEKRKT